MHSKDAFIKAVCNEDGSIKQEFIDSMDKYFAEEKVKKEEYAEKYFERDKEVARVYLNSCERFIDTEMNNYEHKVDIEDLNMFGSYMYHHASKELPVPSNDSYTFTAGIRIYEDFEVELVVGQGSFYYIKLHDISFYFGDGI